MDRTYGEGEVRVVLEEDGDGLSKVEELQRADVVPANENLAFVQVVQAHNELEDCALPGPVRADDDLCNRR